MDVGVLRVARMNPTTCAVLLVNYYSHKTVSGLLDDLSRHKGASRYVISLVDNSENESEAQHLSQVLKRYAGCFHTVQLTVAEQNRGYAAGNNRAYAAVSDQPFQHVFVINPDVRIVSGELSRLTAQLDRSDVVVVPVATVGATVLDGRGALSRRSGRSHQLTPGEAPARHWVVYPGGHFVGMRRSRWDYFNGFSECFFLYGEEADMSLRMQLAPTEVVSSRHVVVSHDSPKTTGSSSEHKSDVTLFHSARSSMILFRRHSSLRPYLPLAFILRIFHGARMLSLRKLGVVASGALSGLTAKNVEVATAREDSP